MRDGWAAALVRSAVRLFPRCFRAEYGRDMEDLFARRWRDARTRKNRAALLVRTLVDIVMSAWAERRRSSLGGSRPMALAPATRREGIVSNVMQDVRYAWRMLRRQPG